MTDPTDPLDSVFAALGDRTRRLVIEALAAQHGVTPTELARRFPVTRQAIAKHLGVLAAAGLVAVAREGREARYTLTPAPLDDAMRWLAGVGGQGDDRLTALERHLAARRAERGLPEGPGLRAVARRPRGPGDPPPAGFGVNT